MAPLFFKLPVVSTLIIAGGLLAYLAAPTRADFVSQTITLNQSNALKDGVTYGSVLIEAYNGVGAAGGGLNAGEVRLTYSAAIVGDYGSIEKSFGIQNVGFNTDLKLKASQITGPGGWKVNSNKNLASFGKFSWTIDGSAKGGKRPNPVTVLLTGLGANATIEHFLFGSVGNGKSSPADGSVYFAMHVAGFDGKNHEGGGHFAGGSTFELPPPPGGSGDVQPTPEPSTILLCGMGMGCLTLVRLSSRRKKSEDA